MSGARIYFRSKSVFNRIKRRIAKMGWPSYKDEPINVFDSGKYQVFEEHARLLTPAAVLRQMLYKRRDEDIKRELLQRLEQR